MDNQKRRTLTVKEAGELLGISEKTVRRGVNFGEIPAIRIGRRILIPKDTIERMLERVAG